MYFAYSITHSYGWSVLIFSVLVSIILYPVNLLAHKNAIRLLQLQPELYKSKRIHAGDSARLNEEQYNIFKRAKYSPFVGLIPLILQLLLVIGMLQVMYHPLQHILRLNPEVIAALTEAARQFTGTQGSFGEQLSVLEAMQYPANYHLYMSALASFAYAGDIMRAALQLDLNFMGLNFGAVPTFGGPAVLLIIPVLSGVTALLFCAVQSGISPGALSQGAKTNHGLTIFTVLFSIYFAFVTPSGIGVYWTSRNIIGTVVIFILDKFYSPKKLAPQALEHLAAIRKNPAQLKDEKSKKKLLSAREKLDVACFMKARKSLVFYALSGGQYKYYENIIDYILNNSEIVIHYITNDPDDAVFNKNYDRFIPYYASQQKTVSLLLRLDADIMATTVPDLQVYHMKRSVVRDDIEYVYIHHGLGSTHLAAREAAYDHFDTIFCVGAHQVAELRRHEELMELPRKNLVKAGYGMYDQIVKSYKGIDQTKHSKAHILIAPSWQADNIMDSCLSSVLDTLLGESYIVYVRPHPQYVRIFPERLDALQKKYSKNITAGELVIDLDFLSNETILTADLVITDWSNIAFEFSYCTLKPCVFIDTPMKILNPKYDQYGLDALEISLRNRVGCSISPNDVGEISSVVTRMLEEKNIYKERIEEVVCEYLYYPGRSGEAGGRYIINQLKKVDGQNNVR